jgi:hypothetical protein
MADVVIQARLEEDVRAMLRTMLPSAVARAMERAKDEITSYAWDITPKRTMRLANSFRVAITLGPTATIHMKWDAVDPVNQFHYAQVVDEGRPRGALIRPKDPEGWLHFFWERMGGIEVFAKQVTQGPMSPTRYSDHMRQVATQFVREALIEELQTIGS